MTERAVVAALVAAVVAVLAVFISRRRPSPPTQARGRGVPEQLDRSDFDHPWREWLVAAFTSEQCESCEKVRQAATMLESSDVGYQEISYQSRKDLHSRYGIAAVPTIVVVDRSGVVHGSFVGAPAASELWAVVAEARARGQSSPDSPTSDSTPSTESTEFEE